jgi:choline dehydrogenase
MALGVARPRNRGRVRLTGTQPTDRVAIEANVLSHPDDLKAAMAGVAVCREIATSGALRPFVNRAVAPGNLQGSDLESFVRHVAETYSHQTCTANIGTAAMSVVDSKLGVYGMEGLRIADGSIMPRITTGSTMAPCMVIGERAADITNVAHGL